MSFFKNWTIGKCLKLLFFNILKGHKKKAKRNKFNLKRQNRFWLRKKPSRIQSSQQSRFLYVSWPSKVLYMSFDRFLLAVESRDLSQADKSIIRVSSFPKLSDGYSRTSFSVSQQLRPELSAKWMLSILSDWPLTRKTEKTVYFSSLPSFEW